MAEETAVSENLQLLADFVADVPVAGMQGFEFAFKGVNVLIGEFPAWVAQATGLYCPATRRTGGGDFGRQVALRGEHTASGRQVADRDGRVARSTHCIAEPIDNVEHIQGPAAFGHGEFGEGFDFAEAVADFADGGNDLVAPGCERNGVAYALIDGDRFCRIDNG